MNAQRLFHPKQKQSQDRGFISILTNNCLWRYCFTSKYDLYLFQRSVFSVGAFNLLGNIEDQLFFVLGTISEDVIQFVMDICFVMLEVIPEEHIHRYLKIIGDIYESFQAQKSCCGFHVADVTIGSVDLLRHVCLGKVPLFSQSLNPLPND